ncbi:MAG: lysine--tRNA ligase [Candidatus Zambryskibacteria bacterium RIFCSPLOWO2_02_FULL_51_21]|uniref:Lysine--tRNA ligase n=1 Tax=Candidatus Zambryskibacteria bacterium RIFCSPHIGHO2_02_FULL_43_37 TaxID=1802749 RepID=A0A1G2THC9_9BACT|nr:MAG: lysine--tRNA ligase [Candidatus Zambryskibacteria bacterium RIFCSPHIGHO2_01_FULL_52_18]OHA96687.1 MAG: lysine--tRNA ligase [Candidatus Zambryskibacteria bacterium RIFCSPHIGHO2_02_FULL_43_37]OHB06710.1 MAG: lysine--tRNA ligase [Candidatus Zambryskibacteria bacterium RIFCSPLOWO2_01_FULL_52_12]OHB11043.1 MAG: lysine--tRNA ligase [Candidatus Zambryskibacteria bacterium RIFCSPLOWO2_02_FULL_51_21]
MSSLEEIRAARFEKLKLLEKKGINPYPASTARTHTCAEARKEFEAEKEMVLAGRIMSLRAQGKIIFFDINDGSGRFQIFLKKGDPISDENFELFEQAFDIGDFVEVKGTLFLTKQDEKTLLAGEVKMLSKSLLPLPEKWHGLSDVEERFRKRYLDLLSNPEVRQIFELKEKFWKSVRDFLKKEGFMEVETPTLEVTTGGAEARPFKTHHNDFDVDVYLRISVGELWQKRLMAGGFPKTFEIGRVYRNEGSSPEHLQEFTNMEFYAAYMNFENGKELIKKLYRTVAWEVFGKSTFETRGHKFDLEDEWQDLDYVETVKKMTGVDVINDSEDKLRSKLEELGVKYDGENRERMTDSLWKHCRKSISGPAFLINHPKLIAPLSKEHPDNPNLTKTFQVIIAGSEIGRAHAELNDPMDQARRFVKQKELIERGDEEAMMPDDEFVEMLEYGMPPTFGFGFGERFFAFLVDKPLRETQLFPLMRPKTLNINVHN